MKTIKGRTKRAAKASDPRFEVRRMLLEKQKRAATFSEYVIRRTETILKVAKKLHPDNDMDFQSELKRLLTFIYSYPPTAQIAKANDLPPQYFR